MEKISIIIPSYRSFNEIDFLLDAINRQSFCPDEVLIIDEDFDLNLEKNLQKKNYLFSLKIIKYTGKSFPPNKRNFGVNESKNDIIAFLDIKTLPSEHWLKKNVNLLRKNKSKVIFGSTKYYYNSYFNKILFFCSYGERIYETLPGTVLYKKTFKRIGNFVENVRAGDDIEWRDRVKKYDQFYFDDVFSNISYKSLPRNMIQTQKKYLIYSFYNAFVEVQNNMKNFYFLIMILFSAIIAPKWNYIISDWSSNPLYISNVTKKYIFSIIIIYLTYLTLYIFNKIFSNLKFFSTFFNYFIISVGFLTVFFWNAKIAFWAEETVLYIPHITKIYLSLLMIFSLVYRGIIGPIKNKVKIKDLLPFNWLLSGILGLYLDLIKAPFYLLGGIIFPFVKFFKKND